MELSRFEDFSKQCRDNLAGTISEILKADREENVSAIGFITTDDFYGFYLTWSCGGDIDEYYDWEDAVYPAFLYQPLVDIVESCKNIDLMRRSDEKWSFAEALLSVLAQCIKQLPEEVFIGSGYRREDITFFATMSDGDYVEEMLDASIKMFNTK